MVKTYNMSYIGQRVIIDVREAIFNPSTKIAYPISIVVRWALPRVIFTNDVAALQMAVVDNLISFH